MWDEVRYQMWEMGTVFFYALRYTLFPPRCAYLALSDDDFIELVTRELGRGSLE